MNQIETLFKYFPTLSDIQKDQFEKMWPLYQHWNAMINVVSRKDIEELYVRHVLHSLSIAKFIKFKPGAQILDLGTGGGFPGIPLAIMFPTTQFHLVDARSKKMLVVDAVVNGLELKNVTFAHGRAEELKDKYDFVVTRAVAKIDQLKLWTQNLIKKDQVHEMPNGIIALKGGDMREELKLLSKGDYSERISIQKYFQEPFFEEKSVVYLQV